MTAARPQSRSDTIDASALADTALDLRRNLAATRLPFEHPTAEEARASIATAVQQLDDYVVPRLRHLDAPALAVVGGSTGAGKSTLVNSLVGQQVTESGVLRPTTRSPVLVHHPDDTAWFDDDRILPGLARVTGGDAHGHHEMRLVSSAALAPGLAVLDAPDVDSVVAENRALANQLLEAADLWLFVTTAARYGDAVPWEFLHRAAQRGVALALVLNRVPPGAGPEIGSHLAEMLDEAGLADVPTFAFDEAPLEDDRLQPSVVAPLTAWLSRTTADQSARTELVRRTLLGAVNDLADRTDSVAAAVEAQVAVATQLRQTASSAFDQARRELRADVRDGTVMRGEVLARWSDVVGTGDLARQLQSTLGRWRDRATAAITGRPTPADQLHEALESGIEQMVRNRVAEATEATAAAWRNHPAGIAVLADSEVDLSRPGPDLGDEVARMIRDWQAGLLHLLRTEGANRRTTARMLSYGVNGAGLVLMVLVFAQTGGLTGAEVAIAGGSSAVGTKLVEALLGDQAVRRMANQARDDLDERVGALLATQAERFGDALDATPIDSEAPKRLQDLAGALREGIGR